MGGGLGLRFNPVLQTEIPLDNPEAVPLLVDIALNVRSSPPTRQIPTRQILNNRCR